MAGKTITTEKPVVDDENVCPNCGSVNSINTDYKHGEVFCRNCGLVLKENLFDFGPEWRAFDAEQASKRARTGGPISLLKQGMGLTTEIDKYDRDIHNKPIPLERMSQFYRLRKLQMMSKIQETFDRNLSFALPELDRMCNFLNIPRSQKEECAKIYRKCVNKKIVRGRSIESVIAALIFLVSKQHQMPKSLTELERISGRKEKEIGRTYKVICRGLGIKILPTSPTDFVPRFASKLGLSGRSEQKAVKIIKKAVKNGLVAGKDPKTTVVSAIFLASQLNKEFTKREFNEFLKEEAISWETVSLRCKELEKVLTKEEREKILLNISENNAKMKLSQKPSQEEIEIRDEYSLKPEELLKILCDKIYTDEEPPAEFKQKCLKLYERVTKETKILQRRDPQSVMTAIVYFEQKKYPEAMSIKKLSDKTGLTRYDIETSYNRIRKELNLKIPRPELIQYVWHLTNKLDLEPNIADKAVKQAIRILEKAKQKGLAIEKNPVGFSSAAIYLALQKLNSSGKIKEKWPQEKIALKLRISQTRISTYTLQLQLINN